MLPSLLKKKQEWQPWPCFTEPSVQQWRLSVEIWSNSCWMPFVVHSRGLTRCWRKWSSYHRLFCSLVLPMISGGWGGVGNAQRGLRWLGRCLCQWCCQLCWCSNVAWWFQVGLGKEYLVRCRMVGIGFWCSPGLMLLGWWMTTACHFFGRLLDSRGQENKVHCWWWLVDSHGLRGDLSLSFILRCDSACHHSFQSDAGGCSCSGQFRVLGGSWGLSCSDYGVQPCQLVLGLSQKSPGTIKQDSYYTVLCRGVSGGHFGLICFLQVCICWLSQIEGWLKNQVPAFFQLAAMNVYNKSEGEERKD